MSSGKWRLSCLDLNVLTDVYMMPHIACIKNVMLGWIQSLHAEVFPGSIIVYSHFVSSLDIKQACRVFTVHQYFFQETWEQTYSVQARGDLFGISPPFFQKPP